MNHFKLLWDVKFIHSCFIFFSFSFRLYLTWVFYKDEIKSNKPITCKLSVLCSAYFYYMMKTLLTEYNWNGIQSNIISSIRCASFSHWLIFIFRCLLSFFSALTLFSFFIDTIRRNLKFHFFLCVCFKFKISCSIFDLLVTRPSLY